MSPLPSRAPGRVPRACSVRERPDTEIVADITPQAVQPIRLDDQEQDDERAEQHETEVGDQVEHGLRGEEDPAEGLHRVTDANGEQGDEDGPEDRAQHRAEPTDDDHGQVVDGDRDLELLVVGDAEKVRVQDPGDPGIEGRDGERQQLVTEDVDADQLGGDVMVADGDERAADAAAHEVQRPHDGQTDEDKQEVVHVALGTEHHRAHPRPRHLDGRLDPAADERHVVDRPLDDELAGQLIIEWTINHVRFISGGVQASIEVARPRVGPMVLSTQRDMYYFLLVFVGLAIVGTLNLMRSRIGRAFIAIRDHDIAAELIGINIFRYKLLAFAISSFYAGVTGVLYTYFLGVANYEQFQINVSIDYLAMIIIGGLGSVLGSIFGAIFVTLLPIGIRYAMEAFGGVFFSPQTVLNLIPNLRLMMFGALIIFFLVVEPEGLNRLWRNIRNYFRIWPFAY